MTVEEIKQRVRAVIDEVNANKSGFIDTATDQQNLDIIIQDKINYALLYVLQNIPKYQVDSSSKTLDSSYLTANSSIDSNTLVCTVVLPETAVRVLSARMKSWKYSPGTIDEGTQEYIKQADSYVRGCTDRPVTALVRRDGKLCLEFYCAKDLNDTADISVVYNPSYTSAELSTGTTEITVPEKYEGAFIYQIAGLTMLAQQDYNSSKSLLEISKDYLVLGN